MKAALVGAALALAGCSGPPLALPDTPVLRASQCSAVASLALEADSGSAPDFGGFTRILHVAMLEGARTGDHVDIRQLTTITQNAPIARDELRELDWRTLTAPCARAYPEAERNAGPLPSDSFGAGMMCFGLADFLARTAADHPRERAAATALADRALAAATPMLAERVAGGEDALRLSDRYMAQAFKAGTPGSVLAQCRERFGR